jgi:predicted enzyme related to lactoylglutathione lyase
MPVTLTVLTFDAAEPTRLAQFWADLLGWTRTEVRGEVAVLPPGDAANGTPYLLFLPVPEPRTAKNRCHPDLHTTDLDAEVIRAVALGARQLDGHEQTSRWAVLADPEGNEFCIVEPPAPL